jgi:hypothetical protein
MSAPSVLPVEVIAKFPAILGYARDRMLLCGRVVMRLADAKPGMLAMLISKRRAIIDAVAEAEPQSWSEVNAIVKVHAAR